MQTIFNGTTEETVLEVLSLTHENWRLDRDTSMVSKILKTLDDPNAEKVDVVSESYPAENASRNASGAVERIRTLLYINWLSGSASNVVTCELFMALGRMNELGWVLDAVPGFDNSYKADFLDRIKNARALSTDASAS